MEKTKIASSNDSDEKTPEENKNTKTAKKSTISSSSKPKKYYRFRPGFQALREIRKYQKYPEVLVKKHPYQKLAREIAQSQTNLPIKNSAIMALQQAAEAYMIYLFQDTNECALPDKRLLIIPKDIKLAKKIRGEKS